MDRSKNYREIFAKARALRQQRMTPMEMREFLAEMQDMDPDAEEVALVLRANKLVPPNPLYGEHWT